MKFLLTILFVLCFSNSACFAATGCTGVSQTKQLEFSIITQGQTPSVVSYVDNGAAVVEVSGQTPGANITPDVVSTTGKICLPSSNTCLTVGTYTTNLTLGQPTPADSNGKLILRIGATISDVGPEQPAGNYTGSPFKVTFTCVE